jgi:nicotinamide-nucleotide amidase
VFAKPTDGLGISDGDEAQFGFSYLEFDIVLMKLCQLTTDTNRKEFLTSLVVPDMDLPKVNRILDRIKGSTFKRSNPYNLEHPLQDNRYGGLRAVDLGLWNL